MKLVRSVESPGTNTNSFLQPGYIRAYWPITLTIYGWSFGYDVVRWFVTTIPIMEGEPDVIIILLL